MPTNRRRRPVIRRADAQTSKRVLFLLLTGTDFSFLDPSLGPSDGISPEDLKLAWEASRDWLLDLHVNGCDRGDGIPGNERPGKPGGRPWGWWQFDAPESRPCDESEFTYLSRLGLLFSGEAEEYHRQRRLPAASMT